MNNISTLAFDLDGTLYCGDRVIAGALDALRVLAKKGYRIFYFTNNSARTRKQIVDKLCRLGFQADLSHTYCTSYALSVYLVAKKLTTIYLIGTNDLKAELKAHHISVKNSARVSAVVVGLDPLFNYEKISAALDAVRRGAKLIVANYDASYPINRRRHLPGCAAMAAAVVSATGRQPDVIIGKPNTYMLQLLCKEHRISSGDICIIGDNPDSDIRMAERLKCGSILFDPNQTFPRFKGSRAKSHQDIISILDKERSRYL